MASTQQGQAGGDAHLHLSPQIDPHHLRQFSRSSRSPHPYYRISSKVAHRKQQCSPARSEYQASDSGSVHGGAAQTTRRHGWTRTPQRTSSDSGTEADDESTAFLKGLPAPPTRSRKGLWNNAGRDDPVLWLHHETPTSWSLFVRSPVRSSPKRSSSDESIRKSVSIARGVILRQKRNEILRRCTETALLLSVGVIVLLREDVRAYAHSWHKGEKPMLIQT
jgi:hypothetical protein